ncbi:MULTISPECIES: hypothetical protein [unclassified Moraxella]|uniref:hypothetical protein n=1 Tax=unclassified Moraxella TaxID=2685852 RepID=UPI00359D73EA
MQTQPIQNTNQAVAYIQSLPINLQQELVDWINVFKEQHITDEMTATEKFYEGWQTWHKENQEFLDNQGLENNDKPTKKRTAGTLKGKVVFADDFDDLYCGEM